MPDTPLDSAILPAGAYIIRNKKISTVLHINSSDANKDGSDILAFQQDEGQYRDQQIWWIEPLAHFTCGANEPNDEPIYSITSPGTGWSLDTNLGPGRYMYAWKHHGEAGQRWKLRKVSDANDGEAYYNIVSVFDSKVVDIIVNKIGKPPNPGGRAHAREYDPKCDLQCWEFVIPTVAFPPGWFQMRNLGTGDLLRHDYVYNSPTFLSPPDSPKESQYREHWEFQWTLAHSKCFDSSTSGERNSWHIINRLTRTHLDQFLGNLEQADSSSCFSSEKLLWKLETDRSGNWKIINRNTSCLLQQKEVVHSSGPRSFAACDSPKFIKDGGKQSWTLSPPLLYGDDASLPEYEA